MHSPVVLVVLDHQFSNVYTPAPGIRNFATDPAMQVDCAHFVSTVPALATGDRLLRLYSGMSAGLQSNDASHRAAASEHSAWLDDVRG